MTTRTFGPKDIESFPNVEPFKDGPPLIYEDDDLVIVSGATEIQVWIRDRFDHPQGCESDDPIIIGGGCDSTSRANLEIGHLIFLFRRDGISGILELETENS